MTRLLPSIQLLLLLLLSTTLLGQDCTPTDLSTGTYLHANNFRAIYSPSGSSFFDGEDGALVQETPAGTFATIFAQGLWLGGTDPAGNLKLAVSTYGASFGQSDYYPGPLTTGSDIGNEVCSQYDQVWTVYRWQVEAHRADFADNGQIDNPQTAILGWPGRGNPSFAAIAGFELPDTPQGLAPFWDEDGDGVYQPLAGDYPITPALNGEIAEQLVWTVFNTRGNIAGESGSEGQLSVEVQLLGWALSCEDNEVLNNTVFSSYRIINRGLEEVVDFRAGLWTDFDLGCYTDDHIGAAPALNTYYAYNADNIDGSNGSFCEAAISTMGENPGVQAVTVLNRPLASFIYSENGAAAPVPPATTDASTPVEYFNKLQGLWKDGTPMTVGGTGYNPGSNEVTLFAFPDTPNDATGWSATTIGLGPGDRRGLGAVEIGSLQPGQVAEIDVAYSFHREADTDNLGNVTVMQEGVSELQALYDANFATGCTMALVCEEDCIWSGDLNADGIANHEDLLAYGFGMTETGEARMAPYNWSPKGGSNWGSEQLVSGNDTKHLDADGNGLVDGADFGKTIQHYDLIRPDYVPVFDYPQADDFTFGPSSANGSFEGMEPGDFIFARVRLLTEVANLRALAFVLEYDPIYFSQFSPLSLSGSPQLSHLEEVDGRIDVAIYSLSDDNVIGGDILNVSVRINNDFPQPLPSEETFVRFRNIRAYLTDGTEVELGAQDARIQIEGLTVNTEEPTWASEVSIAPNPVKDLLRLSTGNTALENVQVLDSHGRSMPVSWINMENLDVSQLASGLYYLRMQRGGEVVARRFVKL